MSANKRLIELLGRIRRCPSMHLCAHSLIRLHAYVDGYFSAWCDNVGAEEGWPSMLRDFDQWIAERFREGIEMGWWKIILFYSQTDYEALDEFWKLWDEFVNTYKGAE
ncbi:MAG: hypothetical protein ACYDCO_26415 [Armatimonadota bacterium]